MIRTLSTTAVLLALATPAAAQMLRGRLVEVGTGAPVAAGRVALMQDPRTALLWTVTDQQGRFELRAPAAGEYLVYAARVGFEARLEGPVPVGLSEPTEVEFRLERRSVALDPVSVSAERQNRPLANRGFYERQRAGFGHFITADEIEVRNPDNVRELLRTVPGVSVDDGASGDDRLRMRGRTSATYACPVKAYLDGIRVHVTALYGVPPEHVEAMEVYRGPSEIPAQYAGAEAACGVILLWTKV
ncbi:MAG TPA: TonB-dependent receptor [Longimicrobium sp.]|nr:TonB-dependent receptor [Longimicrobium sp.]